jgi:hypothetical protein
VSAVLLDARCKKPIARIHALADDRGQELSFFRFLDRRPLGDCEMLMASDGSPAKPLLDAVC